MYMRTDGDQDHEYYMWRMHLNYESRVHVYMRTDGDQDL